MSKTNNSKVYVRLPIILAIGLAAGILIGATLTNPDDKKRGNLKWIA